MADVLKLKDGTTFNLADGSTPRKLYVKFSSANEASTAKAEFTDDNLSNYQIITKGIVSGKYTDRKLVSYGAYSDGVVIVIVGSGADISRDRTIPLENIPKAAQERVTTVADDAARFELSVNDVQNGDVVKVSASNIMYVVTDETQLNSEAGYTPVAAKTATTLSTPRTISLTGDVTGSASFDGSANASIEATVKDGSHKHTTSDITDFPKALPNPTNLTVEIESGTTEGTDKFTYDGSAAKTVNITKKSLDLDKVENKADSERTVGAATKLAAPVNVTVGDATKTFDGSSDISFSHDEMGDVWVKGEGADSIRANNTTGITASGQYAVAEGWGTTASGYASHAEGEISTASTSAAHAEGSNTYASGVYSHAEGESTGAHGRGSHAEGYNTFASGDYSHSEGQGTNASGYASHAEGSGTVAAGKMQHVSGKYNIEDTKGAYAAIVGRGSSDKQRSNAYTLDWNGNEWVAGSVTAPGGFVGNASSADKWKTARTITLTGDASGSVSIDGSVDKELPVSISNFSGATKDKDGTAGFVPAPSKGSQDYYLKGDGSWGSITGAIVNTKVNDASHADNAGLLSTKRKFTIGATTREFNGSSDVTWSVPEILGNEWNAVTQGQKWSRICYIDASRNTEGASGILAITATRTNVVCNYTFAINTSNSQVCNIVQLNGSNTPIRIRGVVDANGNAYIELYDTANSIAAGTAQTWHCVWSPLAPSTLTKCTAFTDGTTIPSGFAAKCDFTTTPGRAIVADRFVGVADAVRDSGDGRTLHFNYSASGMSSTSWLGSWDGNTLKAIAPGNIGALMKSGGTMTGDIIFQSTGTTGTSKKIIFNGSTDGADIYYNVPSSDQGNLVLNMRDDANAYVQFAYNGKVGSYISPSDGTYHGPVNGAVTASTLKIGKDGGSWISGMTQANAPIQWTSTGVRDGSRYDPIMCGKDSAGNVWNLGWSASGGVGFFGYKNGRTDNGIDGSLVFDPATGTTSGSFSGNLNGTATSAGSADILTGMSSRRATMTWGNQTGTAITAMNDSTGGTVGFRRDNPSTGRMSMVIDGTVYVNDGQDDVRKPSWGNIQSKPSLYQSDRGYINQTTDFNTITSAGSYKVQTNGSWGDASTLHSPNAINSGLYQFGILMVYKGPENDSEKRLVQVYMPHNTGANSWCFRWHNGSDFTVGWSDWKWLSTDTTVKVVNNLTTTNAGWALDARMGKDLADQIANKTDNTKLPLAGGTMGDAAYISWPDTGNWGNGNEGVTYPVDRGGFYWSGQSDSIRLHAMETGGDNLELILDFEDDNSNGLSIRNSAGTTVARITANGVYTGTLNEPSDAEMQTCMDMFSA